MSFLFGGKATKERGSRSSSRPDHNNDFSFGKRYTHKINVSCREIFVFFQDPASSSPLMYFSYQTRATYVHSSTPCHIYFSPAPVITVNSLCLLNSMHELIYYRPYQCVFLCTMSLHVHVSFHPCAHIPVECLALEAPVPQEAVCPICLPKTINGKTLAISRWPSNPHQNPLCLVRLDPRHKHPRLHRLILHRHPPLHQLQEQVREPRRKRGRVEQRPLACCSRVR